MANQLLSILMQTRHSALNCIILNGVMQLSKHQVAPGQRCFSFIEIFFFWIWQGPSLGFDNWSPPESDAAGDGVTHLSEVPMAHVTLGKGDSWPWHKAPQRSWVRISALPGLPLALHRGSAAPRVVSRGSWHTQGRFWPWCFDGGTWHSLLCSEQLVWCSQCKQGPFSLREGNN